ncbi:hypothetical protein MATR_21500 [Marivirga tractuosa]|uniref:DUF349 domain-containing protein n=1 Tax=Marivirga tractuosa (strain ATCC 23168 / DSM 4126 / NBRC 15989 / NCIMB 1408 / VKM B-1430 / H-43) TaxID=643867 RepID=E4TL96_MARTH|nr:DUF349 domain-containing protein [Marivirga tractuosa]ADR20234.1 protein of unknown function DUF349 [Marivirga tractuosa DSM 4126]BDD15325.1 hypothetical protein MATR_21500 [Marivirga tractuosa]
MIDEKGTSENPQENNSELDKEKENVESTSENQIEGSATVEKEESAENQVEELNSEQKESEPKEEVSSEDQETKSSNDESVQEEEHEGEHEDEHEELPDYAEFSKEQLVEAIKEISKSDNFKKADRIINELKPVYDEIYEAEKKEALDKFLADGGEEADFAMKHDELNERFEANYQLYRDRRKKHYRELEHQKDENLKTKIDILDRLRDLVDGEETITSLNVIKDIQKEWKSVGPVPGNQSKTLWANYNALLDRYYDQRSILFELKELDRKKNLEAKTELCVKAEELAQSEDVPYAIKHLNDLHEEYKHIGPVPKEEQEPLWQRFKAASDAIYDKRKEFVKNLKEIQTENLEKKEQIIEKLKPFLEFDSDRIKEWNSKTKEILAIQKEWEATGQVPKENAKEINKNFWGNFKQFFANKHEFFKRLDSMREENLKKKQEFVEKAKELCESTDWNKTADQLKGLQRQWKEVGPVPEKFRESIYKEFKAACDKFFENKRAGSKDAQKEFEENLKAKEDIIAQINGLEAGDLDQLEAYEQAYGKIGFVPKEAIQKVKEDFSNAVQAFVEKSEDVLTDEQKEKVKLMAQITKIMSGPNSDRKLNQKENSLRKKIGDLQNDIVTWKNNMEFFASSKTADKLKKDFEEKIEDAEKEISLLKKQLRIVRSID